MPREPNHANAVGCKATKVTKATRIFALGHLATHIDAKVALLKERGFTLAEPLYAQVDSLEVMKDKLRAAPGALLITITIVWNLVSAYVKETNWLVAVSLILPTLLRQSLFAPARRLSRLAHARLQDRTSPAR